MKNHLALVCRGCCWALALILLATNVHGQGWKVKQFSATIDLNEDGSFNVREQITVDFTESKRGIIRKLPYRYTQTNVEGEVAAGHSAGEDYLTPIVDIGVADWTYSVTKTRSAHEIKVGQSDVFLTGEQIYLIDYKVYGAINFFKNSQEFYWNVNGNEWDVPFDNIDVTVNLPKKLKMSSDDVLAFTGVIGSTFNTSATTIEPGKVRVAATRRLEAKEGLTIVLRLPKGFLQQTPIPLSVRAENFVIDSLLTTMTLLEGGQIDVEERIVLNVVVTGADFVRTLEKNYYGPNVGGIPARALHYETKESWIRQRNRTEFEVTETVKGYEADASNFQINISAPNFNETGRHVLRLHYTLWGATQPGANGTAVYLPWLNPGDHEPVAYARVDLRWSGAMKIDMKDALLKDTAPSKGVVTMDANFLRMEFAAPLESNEKVHLGRYFPGRKVKVAAMPLHVFSPDEYFQFYDVDLEIQPNGNIHVVNKFALYRYSWYNRLNRPLTMEYSAYGNRSYTAGRPQSWGRMGKYLVRNLEFEGELVEYDTYTDHRLELWGPKMLKYNGFDTLQYSYDIFGVLASEGGGHRLNFPLVETIDALADRIHFRIRFPGGKVLSPKDISVATSTSLGLAAPFKDGVDMALSFKPGEVSGEIPQGMYSFNELDVNLRIPDGAVAGSFWVSLRLLWINHKALFLPLFFFIPLFIAWFFYGRDKGFTTVVEFYPPEELTPAEAGLLMDDHLHNRDILSLIYYWGAQGCISIQEIYDKSGKATDYKLSKLKKLPKTARKYEKTIFDGLFARGDSTKVSSQKQKFYTYINQARTQINAHAKAKNFYVPGTMGWSTFIALLAWVVAIIAVIATGLVVFEATSWKVGRWEIAGGWALSAALLFFFGKIMPRRGPFGQAQYKKLVGFREFVMRAEKDKLRELVDTNPDYFGMTLPYAIAMGIATKWVDQFGDLLTMPPSYYHTDQSVSTFQLAQFNRMMQQQLDQMAASFNSTPPSTSSGSSWGSSGGSSSSSSSSSSYSSRSSSGGSGFSSGGGYSGGGYGGGGGSAW